MFKGIEIKKLVLVSTLCCVLLIVSVSLYLMISSRNNLRDQTRQMKLAMAQQIAEHLQSCYASMDVYLKSMGIGFGSTLRDPSNTEAINFYTTAFQKAYDADFVIYHAADGRVISTARDEGMAVPDIPKGVAGGEEYVILNQVGGREGTFLVLDKDGILPGDEAIFVIDNTAQIETIKQAYEEEKSHDVKMQVIWVAVIFLLLLIISLAIIHFSITRLLERPISRLSKEARDIVSGSPTSGEEVREGSIFANLQRLLNSGRVVLGKGGKETAADAGAAVEGPSEKRETNKVIAVWAVVTTLLFLAGTIIMLVTSISLTNQKTEAILNNDRPGDGRLLERRLRHHHRVRLVAPDRLHRERAVEPGVRHRPRGHHRAPGGDGQVLLQLRRVRGLHRAGRRGRVHHLRQGGRGTQGAAAGRHGGTHQHLRGLLRGRRPGDGADEHVRISGDG